VADNTADAFTPWMGGACNFSFGLDGPEPGCNLCHLSRSRFDVGMVEEKQWIGRRSSGIHVPPDGDVDSVMEMFNRQLERGKVRDRGHRGQLCGGG
jgi:hypothetical protein